MTNQVFVYGSMTEGMIHYGKIQAAVASSQRGQACGAAYKLKVGYPVLVREGSSLIPGQVIELRSPDFMLALLDEFYGCSALEPLKGLHTRELSHIKLGSGERLEAWVYYLNPNKLPATAVRIETHEWEEALRAPKFSDQLSERQVTYIKKLGAVTGREVIPIDLPLYRELMNLELIVDKGRRLALSKFGQEVYKYLGES